MTASTATVYSARLGAIRDDQLDAAARRLGVGRFVAAAPVSSGLFGQNLFLTTTEGEFVLRGAPHWVNGAPNPQWQFRKEIFFAGLLHEHTDVPVPWPQLYDPTDDIFGWPYVVMPRLRGFSLDERTARRTLSSDEQVALARGLGRGLARLEALTWPEAGEVAPDCAFAAYPRGYRRHLAAEVELMLEQANAHGAVAAADRERVAAVIDAATAAGTTTRPAVYVHADYKLDNLVVVRSGGHFELCGIFDLHTSCFGEGAYDVCRTACAYLDRDEALARSFVQGWRDAAAAGGVDPALLRLFLVNERLKIWEYFTRPDHRAEWTRSTTFAAFVDRYAGRLEHLFD